MALGQHRDCGVVGSNFRRFIRIVCGLFLFAITGCHGDETRPQSRPGQLVVFVLDEMATDDAPRGPDEVFGNILHGDVVCAILKDYGCKDEELKRVNTSSREHHVSFRLYMQGLETINDYISENPSHTVLVNLSLGGSIGDPDEADLIAKIVDKGAILIAAAGNDGQRGVAYPACYPGVIAVGSATRRDLATYSNFGPEIDICAIGKYLQDDSRIVGTKQYTRSIVTGGTSYAAPRVTGTLVEMLHLSNTSAAEALEIIQKTATPLPGSPAFRNGEAGAGVLDYHAAFTVVAPGYWRKRWFGFPLLTVLSIVAAFATYFQRRSRLACVCPLIFCAVVFLTFSWLSREVHSLRNLPQLSWANAAMTDTVVAGMVITVTLLPLLAPLDGAQPQSRWHQFKTSWMRFRGAKRWQKRVASVVRWDYATLENNLRLTGERASIAAEFIRVRPDEAHLLAQWLMSATANLSPSEAQVLSRSKGRHSLLSALLSYLSFDRTELLDIPQWLDGAGREKLIGNIEPGVLRTFVLGLPSSDLKKVLNKVRFELLRTLFVRTLQLPQGRHVFSQQASGWAIADHHGIIEAALYTDQTTAITYLLATDDATFTSGILTLSHHDLTNLCAILPAESLQKLLAQLSNQQLRDALHRICWLNQNTLIPRLPSAGKRVDVCKVLRRLGWQNHREVRTAIEGLNKVDPFYEVLKSNLEVITKARDSDYENVPLPAILVIAVIVIGTIVALWFAHINYGFQ